MGEPLLRSVVPVTLIGAGPTTSGDAALALGLAPRLVAADGGAGRALALGLRPEAVIGDLDSVGPEVRAALGDVPLHRIEEQVTTDFEKCLAAIEAPLLVGIGFVGGRLDHELAALAALGRAPGRALLLGPRDVVFAAPRRLALDLPLGMRLSLVPLRRVTGRSTGLAWPIEGLVLEPEGRHGASNRVTGPVRLDLDGPGLLVLLPRGALGLVVATLMR